MTDESFIRMGAAIGSLGGYYLARNRGVQAWYPHVVAGGLAGTLLSELIVSIISDPHPQIHPQHHPEWTKP